MQLQWIFPSYLERVEVIPSLQLSSFIFTCDSNSFHVRLFFFPLMLPPICLFAHQYVYPDNHYARHGPANTNLFAEYHPEKPLYARPAVLSAPMALTRDYTRLLKLLRGSWELGRGSLDPRFILALGSYGVKWMYTYMIFFFLHPLPQLHEPHGASPKPRKKAWEEVLSVRGTKWQLLRV